MILEKLPAPDKSVSEERRAPEFHRPQLALLENSDGKITCYLHLDEHIFSDAPTYYPPFLEDSVSRDQRGLKDLHFENPDVARFLENPIPCNNQEAQKISEIAEIAVPHVEVAMLPLIAGLAFASCYRAAQMGLGVGIATELMNKELSTTAADLGGALGLHRGLQIAEASPAIPAKALKSMSVDGIHYRPHAISRLKGISVGGIVGVVCGFVGYEIGKKTTHSVRYLFF